MDISKLKCALTHNIDVCDQCQKCGKSGAEIRVKLAEELEKPETKNSEDLKKLKELG